MTSVTAAHDAAGNMTRAPRPGQESTPAEALLNVYDAWNRLVKVFKDSNTNGTLDTETDTPVAEYRYDGTHRRIAKAVKDGNNWDRTDEDFTTESTETTEKSLSGSSEKQVFCFSACSPCSLWFILLRAFATTRPLVTYASFPQLRCMSPMGRTRARSE